MLLLLLLCAFFFALADTQRFLLLTTQVAESREKRAPAKTSKKISGSWNGLGLGSKLLHVRDSEVVCCTVPVRKVDPRLGKANGATDGRWQQEHRFVVEFPVAAGGNQPDKEQKSVVEKCRIVVVVAKTKRGEWEKEKKRLYKYSGTQDKTARQ